MDHLLTVLYIKHIRNNKVIWEANNLKNTFHSLGEEYILNSVFNDSSLIPNYYYFGLDNRASVSKSDEMADLTDEPTTNGYSRQSVASSGLFTVELSGSNYRALSPVITFSASGGSWGPVNRLFLTTTNTASGVLLATVTTPSSLNPSSGDFYTMRMSLSLSGV